MPSVFHEALVTLFRECPRLATTLLQANADIELPASAQVQSMVTTFSDLEPAEYRADAVLRIESPDGQLRLLIVVEVQLAPDSDKHFSWPLYVAGLRARVRAPVTLMVVAIDEPVARWCAQPILLDSLNNMYRPLVIGPAAIPRITEPDEARAFPELAVLSVAAHGQEERAAEIGVAALAACTGLDSSRSTLYADFVFAFLGEAARRALELLMEQHPYLYQSEFARRYVEEGLRRGREEGREEALRTLLADLLSQRFGQLPGEALSKIQAASVDQLDRWARRVLSAATLDDVLTSDS